jgi:hypothetical protein
VTASEGRLIDLPSFDRSELRRRWALARRAALLTAVGREVAPTDGEEQILAAIPEARRDAALRAAFDNSRKLALSLVRYLGVTWEVSDFADALADAGPCLEGEWSAPSAGVRVLSRRGCASKDACGSAACDFWREAIDGFTAGAGVSERFARHASVGHRDDACVDVWFDDGPDGRAASPRWAPVPEALASRLAGVVQEAAAAHTALELLGVAEGVVYCRLGATGGGAACGSATQIWLRRLGSAAAGLGYTVKDVSPTAVLRQET